jgi:hypothetical protein
MFRDDQHFGYIANSEMEGKRNKKNTTSVHHKFEIFSLKLVYWDNCVVVVM